MSDGRREIIEARTGKLSHKSVFGRTKAVARRTPHVMNPKSAAYYKKAQMRASKWLSKFFSGNLTEERFVRLAELGYSIASNPEMINHPHHYKYWSWFMNVSLPNKTLDKKEPNNNITLILESQQKELDYARVKLGIKPIEIKVIESKDESQTGKFASDDDRRSLSSPVRELPAPVPGEADKRQE